MPKLSRKSLYPFLYHMKDNIQLMIPPGVKNSILLDKNLSVMDLLQFPLPGIARESISSANTISQPKSYFSTLLPTITDPEIIQKTLLPPLLILKQLTQDINLTSTSTQSIICQHALATSVPVAGHRFPVWILTYWMEVAQIWPLKKNGY